MGRYFLKCRFYRSIGIKVSLNNGKDPFYWVEPRRIRRNIKELPSSLVGIVLAHFGMMERNVVKKENGAWRQVQRLQER